MIPAGPPRRRRVVVAALVALGLTLGAGQAVAHNPACNQPGHQSGPHYDGGQASDTAFDNNPNLMSPDREGSEHPDHANSIHNREGSCSVGQDGDSGH
jgi:hypothetical protein